jgi:hypothetical protein
MMPGFLSDPVGLDQDDGTSDPLTPTDPSPDWIGVAMGNDNPFFDIRRPGDPGGVGYYRVHTQVQLFDSPKTGCTFGLQAVTPAGLEADGVADGQTVVSPALALFHSLDDGTSFQGFVGKNVNLSGGQPGDRLRHSWQYGVAVHRPIGTEEVGFNNIFFFVEALGRYRYDTPATTTISGPPHVLEVLPGLQWKMSDTWWISGGLVLPVNGSTNLNANSWQITCAIQF